MGTITRFAGAAAVAGALALGTLTGTAGAASASTANPVVTGKLQGPTGKTLLEPEVAFCATDCLKSGSADEIAFPDSTTGVFSEDIRTGSSPYGLEPNKGYRLAVQYLGLETTATLGVNPTYVPSTGYLQKSSNGSYLITTSFAAATSFTVNAADTNLGTLSWPPSWERPVPPRISGARLARTAPPAPTIRSPSRSPGSRPASG